MHVLAKTRRSYFLQKKEYNSILVGSFAVVGSLSWLTLVGSIVLAGTLALLRLFLLVASFELVG